MGKITINQDSLKSRREWKRHKIQDGNNVFRILPPFGDVSVHNNYPYRKWSTAWLVDPKTGRRRPFATPQTDGGECPVREYNEALTKFIDKQKAALEAKGVTGEKLKKRLEGLRKVQWETRVAHTYAYNAADKSGEVGLLELKTTAHQGVKKCMAAYIKEYGQDPTTLDSDLAENAGVWMNIVKEGSGKDTEYSVAFNQLRKKTADGEVIKVDDRSPLSDNIVENYDDMAYDLNTIYVRKSYDELKEILLFNLAVYAEEVPECVLEGYSIDGIDTAITDESEEVAEEEEETPAPAKKPAKQVNLNLDDEEDDVPPAKPAAKKAAAPVAKARSTKSEDEDFMAMADDILGD